jgi:cytochrome c5
VIFMIFRLALIVSLILLAASLWVIDTMKDPLPKEVGEIASTATVESRMPPPATTPKASWLILPTMPESASPADVGAEIYRLVCRDCHGDKGQGLTDEWRATWNPDDQNCWQSKCHASNHPVNGFELPRYVPAIIGPSTLLRFQDVADLQAYIKVNMPWHAPGSLTDQEYWQLTAFLVRENGGDPIDMP